MGRMFRKGTNDNKSDLFGIYRHVLKSKGTVKSLKLRYCVIVLKLTISFYQNHFTRHSLNQIYLTYNN